jgi:hypothetical protein
MIIFFIQYGMDNWQGTCVVRPIYQSVVLSRCFKVVTRGHVKKKSTEIEQRQNGPFMTVLSHCLVHVHISRIKLVGNSHASSLLAQFSTFELLYVSGNENQIEKFVYSQCTRDSVGNNVCTEQHPAVVSSSAVLKHERSSRHAVSTMAETILKEIMLNIVHFIFCIYQ